MTHPRSMFSGSSSSCSHCFSSSMGGGGGKDSIQVRDGVFTALPITFCLGLPKKMTYINKCSDSIEGEVLAQ